MIEGYFLYVKGRVVPRKYAQDIFELRVGSVELLPDVKDVLIQSITISIQLEELDNEAVNDLNMMLREHPGNAEVRFSVKDAEGQCRADLKSRDLKVSVQKELINYIKSREGLDYKIN